MENLHRLLNLVIHNNNKLRWVPEKMDGIFMSIGVTEDNRFFFQTANSPKCFHLQEYLDWARETSPFLACIASIGYELIEDGIIQRFLMTERAKEWPKYKVFEMSFELFLSEFQHQDGPGGFRMIKTRYHFHDRDTIYIHDPAIRSHPLWNLSIRVCDSPKVNAQFDSALGLKAHDFYQYNQEVLKPYIKKNKYLRDQFRQLCYDYFNSIKVDLYREWEGIVVDQGDHLIKIVNPEWKDYLKNPILFGKDRV